MRDRATARRTRGTGHSRQSTGTGVTRRATPPGGARASRLFHVSRAGGATDPNPTHRAGHAARATLGPRAARPYTTVSAALARTPHLSGLTQCRGLCESGTAGAASQPALWLAPKPTVAGFVAGARPRPRPRSPLATPRSRRTRTTAPLNYSGRIDAPSSRRGSAYP